MDLAGLTHGLGCGCEKLNHVHLWRVRRSLLRLVAVCVSFTIYHRMFNVRRESDYSQLVPNCLNFFPVRVKSMKAVLQDVDSIVGRNL